MFHWWHIGWNRIHVMLINVKINTTKCKNQQNMAKLRDHIMVIKYAWMSIIWARPHMHFWIGALGLYNCFILCYSDQTMVNTTAPVQTLWFYAWNEHFTLTAMACLFYILWSFIIVPSAQHIIRIITKFVFYLGETLWQFWTRFVETSVMELSIWANNTPWRLMIEFRWIIQELWSMR